VQVEFVPANVYELTGHFVDASIDRLTYGRVAASHRGECKCGENGIQQPLAAATVQLSLGRPEHPHDQGQ
jgi:hypothetical protein